MSLAFLLKFFRPPSTPPQSWGMLSCNVSVASLAIATSFYLAFALHKVDPSDQVFLWISVAIIAVIFLADSFKHLEYEALSTRLQESREYFAKLRGFSFKKIDYTPEKVEKNIRLCSISIAHFQGLTLFFLMFAFLLHRLSYKFSPEVTIAASLLVGASLPWFAAGQ